MLRAVFVLVAVSGCIEDQLVVCADGVTTCPVGYVCVGDGRCTTSDLRCGDGFLANGETCDGSALGEATCQSEGFYGGELACSAECGLDTSSCTGRCGDGTLDPVEQCDGSTTTSCFELGSSFGRASCGSDCQPSKAPCLDLGWQVAYTADAPIVSATWLGDRYFLRLEGGDVIEVDTTGELNRWPQLVGSAEGTLAGTSRSDVWLVTDGQLAHFDGATWAPVATGLDTHRLITVTSPTRVVVQGMDLGLLKVATWDGTSWTLSVSDINAARMAASNDEIFIVGRDGLVIRDGGTWISPPGGTRITDVASDGTTSFAVGDAIYRIRDGALVIESPRIAASRIRALGDGRFLAFTNLADAYEYDGLTWTKLRTPSVVSTTEIAEAGITTAGRMTLASGQKLQLAPLRVSDRPERILWATDDAVWINRDDMLFLNESVLDANPAKRSLAWGTVDPEEGPIVFVVRGNENGAPTTNRCTRLGCATYPIGTNRLADLEGSSASDVWALTEPPTQLHHFDGTSWSQVPVTLPPLTDLAVAAPDDVYFVGPSGTIGHYDGQTVIFSNLGLPPTSAFFSVRAFPDGRAFAVGTAGLFEIVNGAWTHVLDPVSALDLIAGTSPDDLYALGSLAMYHRDDRGWIQVELPDLASAANHLFPTADALYFDTSGSFTRVAPSPHRPE